ncbi:MAG: ATP-binding protein [Candidatus Margulisiibacteriota bacterium]
MKTGKFLQRNKEFLDLLLPLDLYVRKLLIPLLFVIGLASFLYGIQYPMLKLALVAVVYFFASELCFWIIKNGLLPAVWTYFILLLFDCLVLSVCTYLTGGAIESFLPILFIVIGVLAGLTLEIYMIASLVVFTGCCYFFLVSMEIYGLMQFPVNFGLLSQESLRYSAYPRITPLAYFTVFVAITFMSYRLSNMLKARGEYFSRLYKDLDRSSKLLVRRDHENMMLNQELDDQLKQLENSNTELGTLKDSLEQEVEKRTQDLKLKVQELDVSRKELQGTLLDLQRALKVKEEFLSIVSHELRTPLTPMIDYINLFREGAFGEMTSQQKEVLVRLQASTKRELNLVDSLLDVSRLESGLFKPKKKPIFIKNLILDIISNSENEIKGKKITVETDIAEETIQADESLLVRAFSQLVDNALKFTPKGGKISVRAFPGDHLIKFEVADTGVGVPQDKLERIFDKFYQVDSSYTRQFGGMGLGLTIVKQIVMAHNGNIQAESKGAGHGLTIIMELPIA